MEGLCAAFRQEAKNAIVKGGYPAEDKVGVRVVLHKGERLFSIPSGPAWGWRSAEWNNAYVCGLYGHGNPATIEVGCNPVSGDQVNWGVVKHEFGHYYLVENLGIYSHPANLRASFVNWADVLSPSASKSKTGRIVDFVN